jgi:hypothetical protein
MTDWSKINGEDTLICVCGAERRGKAVYRNEPKPGVYPQYPCHECGSFELRAVYGDFEPVQIESAP